MTPHTHRVFQLLFASPTESAICAITRDAVVPEELGSRHPLWFALAESPYLTSVWPTKPIGWKPIDAR